MNNTWSDTVKTDDGEIVFTWHPKEILDDIKEHQVYGFCMNKGKVVLGRDKDETRFTLPGGRINPGENAKEALIREFREEVQFEPQDIELLGSLEVNVKDKSGKSTDHHQQVRFVCRIEDPGEFVPEKNGWETVERIFVDPKELPNYIDWLHYPTGKIQYREFLATLDM